MHPRAAVCTPLVANWAEQPPHTSQPSLMCDVVLLKYLHLPMADRVICFHRRAQWNNAGSQESSMRIKKSLSVIFYCIAVRINKTTCLPNEEATRSPPCPYTYSSNLHSASLPLFLSSLFFSSSSPLCFSVILRFCDSATPPLLFGRFFSSKRPQSIVLLWDTIQDE